MICVYIEVHYCDRIWFSFSSLFDSMCVFFNFRNNLCNVNIKKKLNSIGHKESQVRFMAVISELVVWDVVLNARCRAYFAVHYRCKRLTLHTTPLNTFFSQWLFLNYRAEKRTAEQMSGEENWRIKKNGWFSKMTATRYDATKKSFFFCFVFDSFVCPKIVQWISRRIFTQERIEKKRIEDKNELIGTDRIYIYICINLCTRYLFIAFRSVYHIIGSR